MNRLIQTFLFACMIFCAACSQRQAASIASEQASAAGIPFVSLRNYFFKNGFLPPANPKITSAEEFSNLFGMATTMGPEGTPTAVDFNRQFVVAIVLPVTNLSTEITPVRIEEHNDSLFYFYDVAVGAPQSFSIQPVALIALDRKYADRPLVLINQQSTDHFAAIDSYLSEQIANHYSAGEYSVPVKDVVAVDASDSTDIRVWGDFWVYNYKQSGDTLKFVSGGSHPGLMHVCKLGDYFYVSAFDQVADGSGYQPSAKKIFGRYFETFSRHTADAGKREALRADELRAFVRQHGIKVTMYQDYGWPAKSLQ